MQLNIPKTSTVSHELPIFTQMSQDSKIPVSEIKARFRQEMLEQHRKAMNDPSMLPMDADSDTIIDMSVESLSKKLENPEEVVDEDKEYNDLFNLEPGDQDPSAQAFSLDNMDLGFSDEGMQSLDSVANSLDDFGGETTGDDINAISEIEPGSSDDFSDDLGGVDDTDDFSDIEENGTDDGAVDEDGLDFDF